MNNIKYIIISSFIISLFLACSEEKITFSDTGNLTGRVVEANSFEPIANAKVSLSPTNNTVFSGEDGYFLIEDVEIGDYSVQAEKEGYLAAYEPVSISADTEVNLIFELEDSNVLNKPPSTPELLSPEDGTTDLPLEVTLTWSQAIDPDEDELEYKVFVRNDFDDSVFSVESLVDTTYVLSNLKHGVKYFWQVSVSDNYNNDVLTTINSFETSSYPNNRYFYVREVNGHDVIFSENYDGESLQVTDSEHNSWRPRVNKTAKLVAFLRTVNSETHLFTMKPDGTDIRQVTSTHPLIGFKQSELDFSWSAYGSKLIFPSLDKLYRINKDGSGEQLIYQTPDGSFITECDWSHDGSTIALKTNDVNGYNISIYTINQSGTVLNTVLDGVDGAAGGINISVDNQYLIYTLDDSGYEDPTYRQLDSNIYLYDFGTATATNISVNKEGGTNDLDPRFAPNEAKVLFVNTSNDGISEKNVFLVDIDGENRSSIISNAAMPDWE